MVRGKIKMGGKLTVAVFSMQITSGRWSRRDLIPLINWARASCAINGITICDNAAVRMIGNGGEKKRKQEETHCRCLLHANCKWGMVVRGSHSPYGLRIRGTETVPINIPLLLSCGGGTENETSAFMHTWKLDILDTICVVTQKFWFTLTYSSVTSSI